MSRIAKIPVTIAKGVTVAITEADVTVKGPVGEVKMHILPLVKVTEENGHLHFEQLDESRDANMNVGTMRALVNDMVKGCSAGFEKRLTLVGVGFRAQAQGDSATCSSAYRTRSCTICPLASRLKRRARRKSSSRVPTSRRLVRRLLKFAHTALPNPTRARVFVTRMSTS